MYVNNSIQMTREEYSKERMKKVRNVLPHGMLRQIADKMQLPYYKVVNTMHGYSYDKAVLDVVMNEYAKVLKELTKIK